MSLATVLSTMADIGSRGATGLASCSVDPGEKIVEYPYAWLRPRRGKASRFDESEAEWVHTVEMVVYVAPRLGDMPAERSGLAALVNSVEHEFAQEFFVNRGYPGGIVRVLMDGYETTTLLFGGELHHALILTFDVKEHTP